LQTFGQEQEREPNSATRKQYTNTDILNPFVSSSLDSTFFLVRQVPVDEFAEI